MSNTATIFGYLAVGAIGAAVGYGIRDAQDSKGAGGRPAVAQAPAAKAGDGEVEVYKVPVGESHQKGSKNALVTIVEFSDFQCPFCNRVNPTLTQIQKTYGDEVRFVFKHNPLPFHKDAPLASEYVLAAGQQGKFWEMHDEVFANQKKLKKDDLDGYAKNVGLDPAKVQSFIESGAGKKAIAQDQKLARQIGAGGTPAFFINGVKLSGAQPFNAFKKVIDERLAAAKALVKKGTAKDKVYAALIAKGRTSPAPRPEQPQRQAPPDTRQKVALVDGTPAKGAKKPLVTIVEFSDFQCPYCSRVNPSIKQALEEYGDDVQVRFRNQPLSFHKQALPAAKAALAAHAQGKFWEMHDELFANQRALSDDQIKGYAKKIGLDMARFTKDLAGPAVAKAVEKDQADARKYGARGTPTLFVNGTPVRGAQPYPRIKAVIDEELALAKKLIKGGATRANVYEKVLAQAPKPQAKAPAAPVKPVNIELGKAPVQGDPKAPVKVVMYSDFQCPFCSRVNPSIEKIQEEYGDKVVVAFKHFPLAFHKDAKPAAIASLAAHRQNKFWPMHEKLFENQKALKRDDLVGYAEELGLNVAKFEKDLDDPALASWVDEDMAEGSKVGVRGTPATFINGQLVSGAQPYEKFKSLIDDALDKS
ncbi:MAG: thioredoxin domain-containing protein [Myxococcota bacterium]